MVSYRARDLFGTHVGCEQYGFCGFDPQLLQVFIERHARLPFEYPA